MITLSPIDTLPPELLGEIFRFAVPPSRQSGVLGLTHVSKRWRAVACGCPWLFTEALWDKWSNELLQLWCSRAGESLLTIRIASYASVMKLLLGMPRFFTPTSAFPPSSSVDGTWAEFVCILTDTRPNWGILCIDFDTLRITLNPVDRADIQSILLRDGLPRGQSLVYKYQDPWVGVDSEDILPVFEAPQLKTVDLKGATLDSKTFCPLLNTLKVYPFGSLEQYPFPPSIMSEIFTTQTASSRQIPLMDNIRNFIIDPFDVVRVSPNCHGISLTSVESFTLALSHARPWVHELLQLLDLPNAKTFTLHRTSATDFERGEIAQDLKVMVSTNYRFSLQAPRIRTLRVTLRNSLPQGVLSVLRVLWNSDIFPNLDRFEVTLDTYEEHYGAEFDSSNFETLWPIHMAEKVERELIAVSRRRKIVGIVMPMLSNAAIAILGTELGVDVMVSSMIIINPKLNSVIYENPSRKPKGQEVLEAEWDISELA
ncbi:hypothetical protein DL93DRAFT_1364122 [Clavulina sp. PMI_390]|nr:hypothetical protein DL93DRAFT_1364122 [Clavulina sp. PMI_390]